MFALLQDVRHALRSLRSTAPTSSLVIILFALGIGATCAVFGVVRAIILKPLPFANSDRIVAIWATQPELKFLSRVPVSAPDFLDWQRQSTAFEKLAAIDDVPYTLLGGTEPEQITVVRVSHDFFQVLDISPVRGRTFSAEEDQPDQKQVVVISHAFWQQRFGGDPQVLNKSLNLNGSLYQIVGVMPPGFKFPQANEMPSYFEFPQQCNIWMPLAIGKERAANRRTHDLAVLGLLKPGVSLRQAQTEMATIEQRLVQQYPEQGEWGAEVVFLKDQIIVGVRFALLVLQGAVVLILLIACANVANLLFARSIARQREIAIRSSLGASPWRIVRQFLLESGLLAAMGGAAGILLATAALSFFTASNLPRADSVGMDSNLLIFAIIVSLLTGLLSGVFPAWWSTAPNLVEVLKEGGKGASGGVQSRRFRAGLVVIQLSFAFLLVASAGVLVRSYRSLVAVWPGFQVTDVLTADLELPESRYSTPESRLRFFRELIDRVSAISGVNSCGVISFLPLRGEAALDQYHADGQPPAKPGTDPIVAIRIASPSYFSTMRIPVIEGRMFADSDTADRPLIVVINRRFAEQAWPNQSALDKGLRVGGEQVEHGWERRPVHVIGVVDNVKAGLDSEDKPMLYFSQQQIPWPEMSIVARTRVRTEAIAPAIKREIYAIDRSQPVLDVKTMTQYLDDSLADRRLEMTMVGAFAAVAVLMAALGLYGLMSYMVSQRRREMAIRVALGAQKSDVVKLVIRGAMVFMSLGLTVGVIAYILAARLLKTLLFGIKPVDTVTIVAAVLALLVFGCLVSYLPARRSADVDPVLLLHGE